MNKPGRRGGPPRRNILHRLRRSCPYAFGMTSEPDAGASAQPDPPAQPQPGKPDPCDRDPETVPTENSERAATTGTEAAHADASALPPTARPAKGGTLAAKIAIAFADIKIAHSVFALPFALLAAFLAGPGRAMIAHTKAVAETAEGETPPSSISRGSDSPSNWGSSCCAWCLRARGRCW